ncbi:MAG: hypothetical protein K0R18_600 [Bacillales bacterium]|jgi:hypothetical protein|nr:hypothetical protein [Bacillales bacterium]
MKKRLVSIVLSFMIILMCVQTNIPAQANSGTEVSGRIKENTIWTKDKSPYELAGNIQVGENVTLTIEDGVVVEGHAKTIEVFDSKINVLGKKDSIVTLNNLEIEPRGISEINIDYSMINQGTPCKTRAKLTLTNSTLNYTGKIDLSYANGDTVIEKNIFLNADPIILAPFKGLYNSGHSTAYVLNNYFYGGNKNILINNFPEGTTIIKNNTFKTNQYAIYLTNGSKEANILAVENYWGTTDETKIEKLIVDKNDDLDIGAYVNYKPYLLSPDLNTPSVDTIAPVISGATDTVINIDSPFDARSAVSAIDNEDGDLTSFINISGSVVTTEKGVYTLTYTISDKYGNTTTVKRKITVIDDVEPVLSGVNNKSVNANTTFNPLQGVMAIDNNDGDITSAIRLSGFVNTKKIGVYVITYTVSDKSGNTAVVSRKITVMDHIKPVISGAIPKTIKLKAKFDVKAGVSAKDNVDGNLTNQIKVTGVVNTKKKGTYTLIYSVTDKSGNKIAVTRKITVR